MSYSFYKILHLISLFVACLSLGGLWFFYATEWNSKIKGRKLLLNIHGISLFIVFVAGFGLIAKLQIPSPWPFWLYMKLLFWLFLGAAPFFLRRGISEPHKNRKALLAFFVLCMVIVLSVITAILKY